MYKFSIFANKAESSQSYMSANSKPLLFILVSFILVFSVSFLGNTITVFGFQFKNINIISDLFPKEDSVQAFPVADSALLETVIKDHPDYRVSSDIIGYEDNGVLQAFVKALQELSQGKRSKVRIAYFGDSMIEGDLISQDLRKNLQDYFGGSGVGFVPITSVVAGFRQTVGHSFSEDWLDNNFLNSSATKESNLFISGHLFRPGSGSTVSYRTVAYPHLSRFEDCYLLYGLHDSVAEFSINDSIQRFEKNEIFNQQLVARDQASVRARFSGRDNQLFGFSFESERGVVVDNFSFRGISGIELQKVAPAMLQLINSKRHYDLIILQYGPNLLFKPELTQFSWYEKPMKRVVEVIRNSFPQTSILVIGSADKACRYDGQYRTQKGVLPLIDIQHKVAYETRTNFWSLYNAMGGHNSMIRWVNLNPPLANVDYTHLTHKGAHVIAKELFDKLMQVYDPEAASRSQIQPIVRYVAASRGL